MALLPTLNFIWILMMVRVVPLTFSLPRLFRARRRIRLRSLYQIIFEKLVESDYRCGAWPVHVARAVLGCVARLLGFGWRIALPASPAAELPGPLKPHAARGPAGERARAALLPHLHPADGRQCVGLVRRLETLDRLCRT
jgi:hypothetical protein